MACRFRPTYTLFSAMFVALVVSGCAGVADDVPAARINGVAGDPVSYCWQNTCADGVLDAPHPELPVAPRRLALSAPIRSVRISVTDGADHQQVTLGDDLSMAPLPEGEWRYLTVSVQFDPTGDALYAWSVAAD